MSSLEKWTSWVDRVEPLERLGFFRIVCGYMLLRHTWAFAADELEEGFYRERFHLPYWEWYPELSEGAYALLLAAMLLSGVLIVVGWKTRWALIAGAALGWFHLLLNEYWYRHNRYFLLLCLTLLCFSPAARSLSADSAALKPEDLNRGRVWSLFLIRAQVTLVYLASGLSKLLDADWRNGWVLWDRATGGVVTPGAEGLAAVFQSHAFWQAVTVLVLGAELFLGFGLWLPWTRRLAVWVGLLFHAYIELRYSVIVFSYLTVGSYFLVVSPERRNRTLVYDRASPLHRFIAGWILALDWFEKVRLDPRKGSPLATLDASGRLYRGWLGIAVVCSALPLVFPLAYPFTWLRFLGLGLDRKVGADSEALSPDASPRLASEPGARRSRLLPRLLGLLLSASLAAALLAGFHLLRALGITWEDRYAWLPVILLTLALAATAQRMQGAGGPSGGKA
ncbi:MAG: HTTM domain-containing protein [Planctomycetes bacterium]|nr:HTTM domain-containing protein [Planctomycetota bacterium]